MEKRLDSRCGAGNVQCELRTIFILGKGEEGRQTRRFAVVLKLWLLDQQHQHFWKLAAKADFGTSSQTHGIKESGSGPAFSFRKSHQRLREPLAQKKFKRHFDQMQNVVFICTPI